MTHGIKNGIVARGSETLITISRTIGDAVVARYPSVAGRMFVAYGGVDSAAFTALNSESVSDVRARLNCRNRSSWSAMSVIFASKDLKKESYVIEAYNTCLRNIRLCSWGPKVLRPKNTAHMPRSGESASACSYPGTPLAEALAYMRAMNVLTIPYPDDRTSAALAFR